MSSDRGELPLYIENSRSRVAVKFKRPLNPSGTYAASAFASLKYDNSLTAAQFRNSCHIRISHCVREQVIFDIVHIDAPLANAIRRVLLVEVPSIAIENVFIHTNTSVMHDEQLAHRLGLVPLLVDPHPFKVWKLDDQVTLENTIKFQLKVECRRRPNAPKDAEAPPNTLYVNHKVSSDKIKYIPWEGQESLLKGHLPKPVHDDILLCKLRPGQAIHVEMHATKNIGKEHAKWSQVCTASYRMLPEVTIVKQPNEIVARRLKRLCPAGVFDLEDERITAARPLECTMCRECIKDDPFSQHVELSRKRDHFIFDVESTGALAASDLVQDAIDVIIDKCSELLTELEVSLMRRGLQHTSVDENAGNDKKASHNLDSY